MQSKRVGYWWTEKKSQKINVGELHRLFVEKGYEFVRIDLDKDIESQGPFDAIIHKLSDVIVKAERDANAATQIEAFEKFVKKHPDLVVVDSLENIRKVLDRYRQYKIVDDSELAKEDGVFIPTFAELTSTDIEENVAKLKAANVQYPFVCKAALAHGTRDAHRMSIIFNESGLKDINPPCVAQTFINHNARLFKLFIIKDKYYTISRPSIKNLPKDDLDTFETVNFDSHDISKPNSVSHLTALDDENDKREADETKTNKKVLDKIFHVISRELGLFLLGIDVIIEKETGRYAIIDINSFPGYDGVDNFLELYRDIVIKEIENMKAKRKNAGTYSNECDSGIDTSDSCDERKKSDFPVRVNKRYHYRTQQQQQQQQTNANGPTGLQNINEKA